MAEKNYFEILNAVNVNEHTEKKNGLTYLSWAWAWAEVKKRFPDATYTVYERPDGTNYWTDGNTCWVKTGVTINGIEHIEELPVMNYNNKSIPLSAVTSVDINKSIQRSLTKACARHGLGLYIYAGEDLPEEDTVKDPNAPISASMQDKLISECGDMIDSILSKYGVQTLDMLTQKQGEDAYKSCMTEKKKVTQQKPQTRQSVKQGVSYGSKPKSVVLSNEQKTTIIAELARTGISQKSLVESYGANSLDYLTPEEAEEAIKKLSLKPNKGFEA